ncbi:MAG: GAF domain-containing protein, partial [Planctomycetota bacterium]
MSTGESKQAYTVEDIKSELRTSIRQLSELARSDATFDEFCNSVLERLIQLTGGHGALLWQRANNGSNQITHKKVSPGLKIDVSEVRHRESVDEVIQNQTPICIDSDELRDSDVEVPDPNAIRCWLLLAPVMNRKGQTQGTLELVQRHNISAAAKDGYLKFLGRIAELFQRWHEHHDLERLSYNAEQMSTTMDFVNEVHKSIEFKETAYSISNEARRLLNCDRVSFARWNGSSCKVEAISSQDRFDNRANVVRKLGKLATACVSGDTTLWITGDTEGIAPEIVRRINDYMDEAHSRTLAVIPLLKHPEINPELEFKPGSKQKPKKLGALILEFFDADVTQEKVNDSVQLIQQHAQIASANALEHDEIFLRPLWKRLGE